MGWKRFIGIVLTQAKTVVLIAKHPHSPWHAKCIAGCTVAYFFSPIQLIPSFIPVIGQMDDLFVVFVGMKMLRKLSPPEILAERGPSQSLNVDSTLQMRKLPGRVSQRCAALHVMCDPFERADFNSDTYWDW